ncbi:MAG: signal recognition particle protein [Deltaproteobacteria bacterium CG11_big_fil_rev_8_21_14_0_20_47_16]|nr:MAG: signal recognition particle protein [Deltaproteobacteria bacterium CG11_big_fil_rev_8_21_14_0_20_47_16]
MFEALTGRLRETFRTLRGRGKLSENHIQEAVREIRMALLSADVHIEVVRQFTAQVAERARGEECLNSFSPAEQFSKIVYEELTTVLGGEAQAFSWAGKPPVVFLGLGLQGSGKTTSLAKLALAAHREKRRPLLVPLDLARPAAIEQLNSLGRQLSLDVYPTPSTGKPAQIAKDAVDHAAKFGFDTVFLDTAGRLAIDDDLMTELKQIADAVKPQHRFLVIDAMAGQTGLSTAKRFDEATDITGVVLSKADGDARGGVALSIRHQLGKPICFIGTGEKPADLEAFYPDRMASRILDMGDLASLVERAQGLVSEDEAREAAKGLSSGQFSLNEFRKQLRMMKKLGSMESMLKMVPGAGRMMDKVNVNDIEKDLRVKESIIDSMTEAERQNPKLLNGSRRKRIALGCGRQVSDVNRLIKEFETMQVAFKRMRGGKMQALKQLFGR